MPVISSPSQFSHLWLSEGLQRLTAKTAWADCRNTPPINTPLCCQHSVVVAKSYNIFGACIDLATIVLNPDLNVAICGENVLVPKGQPCLVLPRPMHSSNVIHRLTTEAGNSPQMSPQTLCGAQVPWRECVFQFCLRVKDRPKHLRHQILYTYSKIISKIF